jgi:endogenous inhibitor of DNA gyrase (YacG/DUF329 family)
MAKRAKPSTGETGQNGKVKGRCPICQSDTVADYRPFCSKRCADVDLGRWLSGTYVIPETDVGDDDRSPIAAANDDTPDGQD